MEVAGLQALKFVASALAMAGKDRISTGKTVRQVYAAIDVGITAS